MIDSAWNLPGPRRFAEDIAVGLEEGRTSIIFVPDRFCGGTRAAISGALVAEDWRFLELDADALEPKRPLLEAMCAALALTVDTRVRLDIGSMLDQRALWRRILFVDLRNLELRELALWADFISQHVAASRDRPLTQRLSVCAICGATASEVLPQEDVSLRRYWWWGVLSRLDAEVFVAQMLYDNEIDPVVVASIVEVAAFDLALAELLVERWQGEVAELASLLGEYAEERDLPDSVEGVTMPRSNGQPPKHLLDLWSLGAANRWSELDPCLHSATGGVRLGRELKSRVWRAQVRTLLPEIELERQRLAEWALRHRRALNAYWAREDIAGLEIGPLCKLIGETTALRGQVEQWELAQWLRYARNLLAHWNAVDAAGLRKGRHLIERARDAGWSH